MDRISTFLFSLKVMGIGLIGIFSVTILLILVMVILTKLFPARKDKAGKD